MGEEGGQMEASGHMAMISSVRDRRRYRLGVGLAAVLALGLLFLLSTGLTPAGAAIPFERCQEEGAEDWECAKHTVPLDWTGKVPGTIDLEVRRYRPPGSPDPSAKLPFVALAGGPGESATGAASLFSQAYSPALADYQLIVYDQRGTGLSGALYCPALKGEELEADDTVPPDVDRKVIARCAEQLGPKRAFYTTVDSTRDIDSIRQALGAPRIGIGGVSYGTYVSAVYAQQYPARTDRIILDGVVDPGAGISPFNLPTLGAVPRVLREQCEGGRCAKVTSTPVGDLRRIVGRVSAQEEQALVSAIIAGDSNPALRGGQPAAFRSRVNGDKAPYQRFLRLAGSGDEGEAAQTSGSSEDRLAQELRVNSQTLQVTTRCTDLAPPWPQAIPPGSQRNRLFSNALAAVPPNKYSPFGRPALTGGGQAITSGSFCLKWPLTDSAPLPEHPPFPDVPTLIVNGTADVRTPAENAIEAARDFTTDGELVLVEGYGHALVDRVECLEAVYEDFFADQSIGDPCAGTDAWAEIQPLPPRKLRQVKPDRGIRGKRGRTLAAARATVDDAEWVFFADGALKSTTDGLRGGKFKYEFDVKTRKARFVLKRLSYVPGVRLSGELLRKASGKITGRVRIRGKKAARGKLNFKPNGNVVGRLNGNRVRYRAGK